MRMYSVFFIIPAFNKTKRKICYRKIILILFLDLRVQPGLHFKPVVFITNGRSLESKWACRALTIKPLVEFWHAARATMRVSSI